MFGYIRPSQNRLSAHDQELFESAYCGLCHELGRKYGFSARFVLNFDFTFLAILLSEAGEPACSSCRCIAHPCKARCVMQHAVSLETAADHSIVLAWWQLRDHIADHGLFRSIPYRLSSLFLRRAFAASFFTPSSLAFIIAIFLTICIGFARPDIRKFFYCDLMKQHACYLSAMFVQEIRDQALVHARFHCRIDGLFQITAVCAQFLLDMVQQLTVA